MPGTAVGIDRNGPPVAAPGLGSHVSSWLAPPASQSRMHALLVASQLARQRRAAEDSSAGHVGAHAAAPAAAIVPRNPRRLTTCSGEPQKNDRAMKPPSGGCVG